MHVTSASGILTPDAARQLRELQPEDAARLASELLQMVCLFAADQGFAAENIADTALMQAQLLLGDIATWRDI